MDPIQPLDIFSLLKRFGIRPDKSLGQNFLIEDSALRKIVSAADLSERESILEIGPGLGSLTRYLAALARQVVAVELDERLIPVLKQVLAPYPNIRLVQGDILAMDPAQLMDQPGYLVVANIPYYITSPLIRHLLEAVRQPQRLVLTVQGEVAGRICAAPGDMSLLALSVQVYGEPQIVAHISAGAFYPIPQVDSAVVRVDLLPQPRIPKQLLPQFFRLAKAGFSQKRKTLRNALAGGLAWPKDRAMALLQGAAIDPQRRAETLSLEEWRALVELYASQDQG